jgi:hypothetical protein
MKKQSKKIFVVLCGFGVLLSGAVIPIFSVPADAQTGSCLNGKGKAVSEGWEERFPDGRLHVCSSGKWVPKTEAVIVVEDSMYGTACCGAASKASHARGLCNNRQKCSIDVNNIALGGDPVPNHPKHMWVRYHCERGSKLIQGTINTITIQEGGTMEISCVQP